MVAPPRPVYRGAGGQRWNWDDDAAGGGTARAASKSAVRPGGAVGLDGDNWEGMAPGHYDTKR